MNAIAMTQTAALDALMDPNTFAHMATVAQVLVDSCMLPDHLRGQIQGGKMVKTYDRDRQIAMATVVLAAAKRFDVDVFHFAQSSFIIHGKLDFDGKVYIALANARAGLAEKLTFKYIGEGDQMRCICSGRRKGERESREIQTPPFIECAKDGGKMRNAWVGCDPEQQLSYYAGRVWVRRHCPEVLLGMGIDEDVVDEPDRVHVIGGHKADSNRLLEHKPNVALHLEFIKSAETIEELKDCRNRIDADTTLTKKEINEIHHEGRQRAKELEQSEPAWKTMLADCEAILTDSDDPKAISEAWKQIESSEDIPIAEGKRLGKLFNERMKEFVPQEG